MALLVGSGGIGHSTYGGVDLGELVVSFSHVELC